MCCNEFVRINYSKIRRITSVNDMIQIMTVGNQLNSSLSYCLQDNLC